MIFLFFLGLGFIAAIGAVTGHWDGVVIAAFVGAGYLGQVIVDAIGARK